MNRKPPAFSTFQTWLSLHSRYVLSGSKGNLLNLMQANRRFQPTRFAGASRAAEARAVGRKVIRTI